MLGALFGLSQMSVAKAVKAPAGGKKISKNLIGIFFEDISYSADGGLYAELVQNGSFEFSPNERDFWGPATAWRKVHYGHSTGYMSPETKEPLNSRNPHYMRIFTERTTAFNGEKGIIGTGISNEGFDGISLKAGETYNFSAFLRTLNNEDMPIRVALTGDKGKVVASCDLNAKGEWQKYEAALTANETIKNARLEIVAQKEGVLDVDMVSLMPKNTFKGHGLRQDLAQNLADLQPKFVRFPGGCVVHGGGDGFWATYRWKNTVGKKEERIGTKNPWGYHQSMGLGYYEYFQFCEDIGAEPLPILPVGVSCQGAGGGWGIHGQAQSAKPMAEMQEWADDVLDLVEWANGAVTTKWGKVRAEAGHPEPFNLKYIGLGNEEKISPEFEERFRFIYKQLQEKHPEITVVGTAGPGSHKGNPDYDNGWRIAEAVGMPIIDEHYYEKREYFYDNQQNYDAYPRDRKTKVYLGEYASKDKKMADALAEALYLLHVERNGDVVEMTSYAPLFAKKNHESWNPDLIYFDNERSYLTCSYFVQQYFGTTSGNWYYGDVAKFQEKSKYLGTSTVMNTEKGEVYIKFVNALDEEKPVTIDLSRFKGLPKTAGMSTLQGAMTDENNYDKQPVSPKESSVKVKKAMTLVAKPHSMGVLRLKLK